MNEMTFGVCLKCGKSLTNPQVCSGLLSEDQVFQIRDLLTKNLDLDCISSEEGLCKASVEQENPSNLTTILDLQEIFIQMLKEEIMELEDRQKIILEAWDDLLEDLELDGKHNYSPYIKSKQQFKILTKKD